MIKSFLMVILLFIFPFHSAMAFSPLPSDKAFEFSASVTPEHQLSLHWTIAPGYFLYRNRIKVTPMPQKIVFPVASRHNHEAVYVGSIDVPVVVKGVGTQSILLEVHYQGCAEAGFCYAPIEKNIRLTLSALGQPKQVEYYQAAKEEMVRHYLSGSGWLRIIAFLGMGFLLALTPCVLPMVPILSAIVVGSHRKNQPKRAFFLSLTYVLGMAMTYAIAGMIVALIGRNIQSELQQPGVIIFSGVIFILLALSLLGLYDFRLPNRWQKKLAALRDHQQGGTFLGVFLMGCFSTLVISPCVSAPLVGVLAWIGQTGNIWMGATALLALGFGMGIPLLLIGASLGRFLPRTGYWMMVLEKFFGVVMLGMAIWIFTRLIPATHSDFFKIVPNLPYLNAELQMAKNKQQPVMVDFYANWCESCVAMDKSIFARAEIRQALADFLRLRVDLTYYDETTLAIEKRFHVIGPPTILFFDCANHRLSSATLVGETTVSQLISKINKIRSAASCQLKPKLLHHD